MDYYIYCISWDEWKVVTIIIERYHDSSIRLILIHLYLIVRTYVGPGWCCNILFPDTHIILYLHSYIYAKGQKIIKMVSCSICSNLSYLDLIFSSCLVTTMGDWHTTRKRDTCMNKCRAKANTFQKYFNSVREKTNSIILLWNVAQSDQI